MANKQRNNVAILPFEARKLVCRMLLDNRQYAAINAAVKAECPETKTLHSTTFRAYQRSDEYKNYRDGRMQTDHKLIADRWAADALRECAGIETVTDMAEMALANQLRDLADKPGAEISDLVKLVKSVTAIKRTNLVSKDEEHKQEIKKINERHASELAEKDAKIAELSAKLMELSSVEGKEIDSSKVADALNAALGVR